MKRYEVRWVSLDPAQGAEMANHARIAEATGLTAKEKLELQELLNASKGSRAGPRGP